LEELEGDLGSRQGPSRGKHVGASEVGVPVELLGAPGHYLAIQVQLPDYLLKEPGPFLPGLDQAPGAPRGDRQGDAGQTCAGSDVDTGTGRSLGKQGKQTERILDVALSEVFEITGGHQIEPRGPLQEELLVLL